MLKTRQQNVLNLHPGQKCLNNSLVYEIQCFPQPRKNEREMSDRAVGKKKKIFPSYFFALILQR